MLTERRDLRSGTVPWDATAWDHVPDCPLPSKPVDIAIIGAGVMGAILAERLSGSGHQVALLDRRHPGHGSTAASTAEIMWGMDLPLSQLAEWIGEKEASRRWRRVFDAVRDFAVRIDALGIDCHRKDRPTLYLEGNILGPAALAQEAELHRRHDLPTRFLDDQAVAREFAIAPRAGLVSSGGFEVDPVRLTHGMLATARARGAEVTWPIDIISLQEIGDAVELEAADGRRLQANHVILAGGYERAPLFLPQAFSLLSTFVIATPPGTAPLWKQDAMIWEASDPYLYIRTGPNGEIIAGGEDIEAFDPAVRDAVMPGAAGRIAAKMESLLGCEPVTIDRVWSATFGSSPDSLPAIGRSSLMRNVWLSAGFGGNGIAFAALAADMLDRELSGSSDPDSECFSPYRFG